MTTEDRERLILDYTQELLEHLVGHEKLHPEVCSSLVRIHLPLIENSFAQFFPVQFCAERIRIADLRNANSGGPMVGFIHKNPEV